MGAEPIPIGCSAIKPVERHGWEAVSWFLYDKNTGAIMGRTPLSWVLITVFYIIYYAFLAGFWALMLIVFFQFIDDKQPMWQQDRIGRSPALGVRPGQDWHHIDSGMIIFNQQKVDNGKTIPGYGGWVERTSKFLEPYKGKPELTALSDCSGVTDKNFGYSDGSPCILLKLNKIYGLEHEYITEARAEMPKELQDRVKKANGNKHVWVSCEGENAADQEAMGEISYFPENGGFPEKYFPYLNQDDYLSPLIAVKFPKIKDPKDLGQFLHIECRAWADNIKYHRRDRVGIAHFELMIHDDKTAKDVDGAVAAK
jgi:sodium/potassium-transporting ATPase subunit beta